MAKIALNFEDGVTRFIDSLPNETVAETAYRVGINIPLDCADGACGTCKCKMRSGNFDAGDYIEEALSDEEAAAGFALACQVRPKSDLVVDILASSGACKVKSTAITTEIKELNRLSSEIYQLKLRAADGSSFQFLPGQYANIEVPGTSQTRSYSYSSQPDALEAEFLIKLVPGGLMSMYLKEKATVGGELNIVTPLGSFYLREAQRDLIFIAGGTGIAPFMAMLEKLKAEKNTTPIHLFYGATTGENIVELERLKAFSEIMPLQLFTCTSDEQAEGHDKGFVTQWINKDLLGDKAYDVYICGPNAMVEAVKTTLDKEAIQHVNFYMEKFVPTGQENVQL
ncbi:benzoate 1,2-dioxygenase electron transfer component BenC [Flavobacterium sp.]|uniref:benzoate 1,2-dioxygenase electron transfer component BenC n=1 Tax=Flavobacterium sp. TaxID=239 RepID=UPI001B59B3D8|nr:benzoate 1,2-dioxygenase electron transfer component BenC [Flavobacterium sp.]MBP6181046.1 2Fe-2S iron-sulfur cluster binding domain-containing protein [Flavobacterium sp.]